jgi:hypothetical protein
MLMDDHKIGGVTDELYQRAVRRVRASPRLSEYEDIIFADWSEGDDHLRWVATATVKEIESWAKQIKEDGDATL